MCSFIRYKYSAPLKVTGDNKGVILEIRRERRIELVMEGFRMNDLMRWKEGHLLADGTWPEPRLVKNKNDNEINHNVCMLGSGITARHFSLP